MRLLFFGNQDNLGYELCGWSRQLGVEGEVYSFDHDLPRSQPELVDAAVGPGRYPSWFHDHQSPVAHVPIISRRLAEQLEQRFDVLVVSGTRGLLASNAIRRLPRVLYAIGGEVSEAPFPFAGRWRGLHAAAFRILRSRFARKAIRRMDRIIENYEPNLRALDRLGLAGRRVCLGCPENATGNRALVNQHLLRELQDRYHRYHRVFLWLTRVNFLDPQDAAYKGTERYLAALAPMAEDIRAGRIRLVFGAHGHDVPALRQLITTADLDPFVDWVPHLAFPDMLAYLSLPNAVVFGKFGEAQGMPAAIDRDCMTTGTVLISTVDLEYTSRIYGAVPPVLDAVTTPEITARIRQVMEMDDAEFQRVQQQMLAFGMQYIDYRAVVPRFLQLAEHLATNPSGEYAG